MSIYVKDIAFESQGAILRGQMYLPKEIASNCPTVIMAHGFSTTIKMTANKYAEEFRKAGYVVILYDHRNLGASGGEPRQEINYWVQARGYIDCIDFALNCPEVDSERIALWGCSSSARLVFVVASIDPRPKAIVAQVPALGATSAKQKEHEQSHDFIKNLILNPDILAIEHTAIGPTAVVSRNQEKLPSYLPHDTAADWFFTSGERLNSKWINEVTISRVNSPYEYHPFHSVKKLNSSVLFVVAHDDEIEGANPKVVREIFNAIDQPKKWIEINGGHFGLLYYPSTLFDQVSQAEIDFLNSYL